MGICLHSNIALRALGALDEDAANSYSDEQFHVLHIPTQPNGTDCGYYVVQTIRMLVEEFIQGFESNYFVSIS